MADQLRIRIDREACRGAGECAFRAPDSFRLDEDGKAVAESPPRDDEERLVIATRSCPHFAISLWRGEKRLG